MANLILRTDSYKLTHWKQYPAETSCVYSYFEARKGATFPNTVFFGLAPILRTLVGRAFTDHDIAEAESIAEAHFGSRAIFNREGWEYILSQHDGRLPIEVKSVAEGTVVPPGNVLMTVQNTDPNVPWLTNALESLLTHVWYPTTVASLSRAVKADIAFNLDATVGNRDALPFMLHDFGYRGATTDDAAAIGGAAHLVNFQGTDTLLGMMLALREYRADLSDLAFSVPATEHSVMTALGKDNEYRIVDRLLDEYPTGILSVVADSYNIYEFVNYICQPEVAERINERDGVFVVRPDSVTNEHKTPAALTSWILGALRDGFGATPTKQAFWTLNSKVRVLWGDGIDRKGINDILDEARRNGFAADNLVFGMGGGLLQKVNRDTQRFAFKSSAQRRAGQWHDISKEPLDASKTSKAGRLKLIQDTAEIGGYRTVALDSEPDKEDQLVLRFKDGVMKPAPTFEAVRARAAL